VDGNELLILRGMRTLLSESRHPKSIQVEINQNLRSDIVTFMQAHGYVAVKEHHTRKGAELIESGRGLGEHAYNMIFQPKAR
jgi:hypothetical protein